MKIGFTSRVCPEWDLTTMAKKAAELGYDGVELGGLGSADHLPAVSEFTSAPEAAERMFAGNGVELACLGTGDTLEAFTSREVEQSRARILELIQLAGHVGCPFVRVPIGNVPTGDHRDRTLTRLARMFQSLAVPAARHHVTVLVENGGDFPGSEDLWFVVDHASHPAVAVCWNPCPAMTQLERPTTSIPRLAARIKVARICDGTFDERGRFGGFRIPGEGDVELGRMVSFLRGLLYQGYLMFDWPKAAVADLPAPDAVLGRVQAQLRDWIDTKSDVLTAYKGDKKPVRLNLPSSGTNGSASP